MNYHIVLGTTTVFTGDVLNVMLAAVAGILFVALTIKIIARKLRENQVIKYEFITIIAHKFRTPLTQVKWILDSAVPGEDDPLQKKNLLDIQKANEKLIALMGTLIELTDEGKSGGLTYAFERVTAYDFVREIADSLQPLFQEKNISISVQATDPTFAIKINKIGMRFVIQALLENSCVYSPPGRRVDVIIFKRWGKVYISVTDDGIGIQPRDLRKVFSKFYRARNAKKMDTEGFGVSLFMAKTIVRRNGAKLHVFSAGLNQGSTFTVILPRVK